MTATTTRSRTAILFHGGCTDGFTAAWIAHNALGRDRVALLHGAAHGEPPPHLDGIDEVFILDFAWPHQTLVDMTAGGHRRVVVLDHHRTTIDDVLDALGTNGEHSDQVGSVKATGLALPYEAQLDDARSGAGITWDYFHPGEERPALVAYVEDRDLWRNQLPDSRAVSAFIRTQPHALGHWNILVTLSQYAMVEAGTWILEHIDHACRLAAQNSYWCRMGDRTFPIANVTYDIGSDVANHLLGHHNTTMAGYYFRRPDGDWQYGFRSRDGVTVHDHAQAYGGGGHEQAAGCHTTELAHERVEVQP
jgi:hypothetical protein